MTERNLEQSTDAAILAMIHKLNGDVEEIKTFMMGVEPETHKLEHEYIRLAIEKETQRAALRRAIIEKTLTSLIWSALVAIGYALWQTFSGHPIPPPGK